MGRISEKITFKQLRYQMNEENSDFYIKLKDRNDSTSLKHKLKLQIGIGAFDFFIAFILGGIESKEYMSLINKEKGSDWRWDFSIGRSFLYKEHHLQSTITFTDLSTLIEYDENSTLSEYHSILEGKKFGFKTDEEKKEGTKGFKLNKKQMDDLEKVYNYLISDCIDDITLGDLREQLIKGDEPFSSWVEKKTNNYFLNKPNYIDNTEAQAFMLLMAIVLGKTTGGQDKESYKLDGKYNYDKNDSALFFLLNMVLNTINDNSSNQDIWNDMVTKLSGKKYSKGRDNKEFYYINENLGNEKNNDVTIRDLYRVLENEKNDNGSILSYKIRKDLFESTKTSNVEKVKNECYNLIQNLEEYNNRGTSIGSDNEIKIVTDIVKNAINDFNQVIFTGAPGTGKTYSVRKYVKGFGEDRYKFVQFHPSYDYSDFIEGLRPVNLETNLSGNDNNDKDVPTFVRMDGVFKKFCREIVENNLKELGFKKEVDLGGNIKEVVLDIDQNKYEKLHKLFSGVKEYIDNQNNNADNDTKDEDYIKLYLEEHKNDFQELLNIDNFSDNFIKLYTNKFEEIVNEDNNKSDYYYFVVDEVNRADLSKVFGEIMFGLEKSYRGIENRFDTQYMNLKTYEINDKGKAKSKTFDCFEKGFFIPRNLKFIGTMNDIDRSVESFDFALRRRFDWKDIKANSIMKNSLESLLKGKVDDIDSLSERIIAMNNVISGTGENQGGKLGLNEAYHIGPAYFKSYKGSDDKTEEDRTLYFESHIESIIREYVRGRRTDDINKFVDNCKRAFINNVNNVG